MSKNATPNIGSLSFASTESHCCWYCGRGEDALPIKLQKCGRCGLAVYCNRECQRGDWKLHKAKCKKPSRVTGDRVLFIDVFNASDFANSLVANSDIMEDGSEVDGYGNFDMICAQYKTVVVGDSYANVSEGSWLSEYYKRGGRVVIIAWMGIFKFPQHRANLMFGTSWKFHSYTRAHWAYTHLGASLSLPSDSIHVGSQYSYCKGNYILAPKPERVLASTDDDSTPVAIHKGSGGEGEVAYIGFVGWFPEDKALTSSVINLPKGIEGKGLEMEGWREEDRSFVEDMNRQMESISSSEEEEEEEEEEQLEDEIARLTNEMNIIFKEKGRMTAEEYTAMCRGGPVFGMM